MARAPLDRRLDAEQLAQGSGSETGSERREREMRLRQSDAQSAQARHETITFQGVIRVSPYGLHLFGYAAARSARVARHRRQVERGTGPHDGSEAEA